MPTLKPTPKRRNSVAVVSKNMQSNSFPGAANSAHNKFVCLGATHLHAKCLRSGPNPIYIQVFAFGKFDALFSGAHFDITYLIPDCSRNIYWRTDNRLVAAAEKYWLLSFRFVLFPVCRKIK